MPDADDTLLVNDDERREALHAVFLRQAFGLQRRVIELELVHHEAGVFFFTIRVHAQHDDGFALVMLDDFLDLRHGLDAPAAAAIPEIEHDHLAATTSER